jgi:putative phage-type endonuclease
MIILDCEQGTSEWLQARLGIPTASSFDSIITSTGKPSTQADAYANKLIAEWLVGAPVDEYKNDWMLRGNELEPQARAYYEMQADCEVKQVGFVLRDDRRVGCSPDGLTAGGLVEIKCPAPHTHVEYLLNGKVPTKYIPQVQGQMLITESEWCDFVSYHPLMPPVIVRVARDEKFIAALNEELDKLLNLMADRKAILINRGLAPLMEAA